MFAKRAQTNSHPVTYLLRKRPSARMVGETLDGIRAMLRQAWDDLNKRVQASRQNVAIPATHEACVDIWMPRQWDA